MGRWERGSHFGSANVLGGGVSLAVYRARRDVSLCERRTTDERFDSRSDSRSSQKRRFDLYIINRC